MHPAAFAIASVMSCLVVSGASAKCDGGTALPNFLGRSIVLAQDTLFFRTTSVQLDIDGSPSAYGVRDQGLEDICNGLGPLQPAECRGKNRGPCYAACQQAFSSWDRDLSTLGKSMCSIGLGGGGCSPPNVRLQPPPREGFFVSETSVHVKAPTTTQSTTWIDRQDAQLDSLAVPYFVIPAGFRKLPWDATPGDIGVIVKRPGNNATAFIVGDIGGALDEASARLIASLRGVDQLPQQNKLNALAEKAERLEGALGGDFRVAIFRHSAPYASTSQRNALMLDKIAAELPGYIRDQGAGRLQSIGGVQRLLDCTE